MPRDRQGEHCFFKVLNNNTGHCTAYCHHHKLVEPGITEDCIGKRSETIGEYVKRVETERKRI